MGWNDHVDFDLHEDVEELVEGGEIEKASPAYGVAQQVIHQGYNSLTPKQRTLYDAVVVPALERQADENEVMQIMNSARD